MKTVEDILKENRELFQEDPFDEMYWEDKEAILTVMKLNASDREAKYKELWGAMKELIIERDKPFANKYHGRAGELINKITALEQELGLNKEGK